jgi:hypothetical protein
MPLRIAQLDHHGSLPKLWPEEALDDLDCDDSSLLVSRGNLARLASERWSLHAAATVTQVAVGQGEQGHTAGVGEWRTVTIGVPAAAGPDWIDGELVRVTHYTCVEANYGGTHYCPEGSLMASGWPVFAGAAACAPSNMNRRFRLGGLEFTCLDTGSLVTGVDLWCWSFECWDEGCQEPCPAFSAFEVIEWLSP